MASPFHRLTGIFRLADRSAGTGRRRRRMRALPALRGRAVIAALERAGFEVIRTKGSHHFLRHRNDPSRQTVVPVHRNDLPPGALRAMLRQARLSRAQFLICSEQKARVGQALNSSSSVFAFFRSVVSKPSVNQP
jgi:predicted RNA binding protein YcfA (HicA-like mRNA interferase family)